MMASVEKLKKKNIKGIKIDARKKKIGLRVGDLGWNPSYVF